MTRPNNLAAAVRLLETALDREQFEHIHDALTILAALAAQEGERNQCDGCARGLSTERSEFGGIIHRGPEAWDLQGCTADRYGHRQPTPEADAGGVKKYEIIVDPMDGHQVAYGPGGEVLTSISEPGPIIDRLNDLAAELDQLRRERDELRAQVDEHVQEGCGEVIFHLKAKLTDLQGTYETCHAAHAHALEAYHQAEKQRDEAVRLLGLAEDELYDSGSGNAELANNISDFLATLKGSGEG